LIVFLIAAATLAINYFIPSMGTWLVDGIIRTGLMSVLFLAPVLYFELSPDVNDFLKKARIRIR
jgi:hypothetical protein